MGKNPYIKAKAPPPPKRAYKLTLANTGAVYDVNPEALPGGHEGLPGSVLSVLLANGVEIDHSCGGVVACSTCHVYVEQGLDSLGDISDKENDIMDKAFDVRPESRLGCQAHLSDEDVEVEISEESLKAWLDEHPELRRAAH